MLCHNPPVTFPGKVKELDLQNSPTGLTERLFNREGAVRMMTCGVLLAWAVAASPICAEQVVAIHVGAIVTTADGKRLGRIYDMDKARDGTVMSVAIFKDNRIIRLPAPSLSAGDEGLITSLTSKELKPKS